MNGFTGNRAQGASGSPGSHERVLTWNASAAMLPLVRRIAQDVVNLHVLLGRLRPEQTALEARRHSLTWPGRARRYEIDEEVARAEKDLLALESELEGLGLSLLDPSVGLVGFPTIVNDRPAFFSWLPGEAELGFWNFSGDLSRRPIPSSWTESEPDFEPVRAPRRRPRPRR